MNESRTANLEPVKPARLEGGHNAAGAAQIALLVTDIAQAVTDSPAPLGTAVAHQENDVLPRILPNRLNRHQDAARRAVTLGGTVGDSRQVQAGVSAGDSVIEEAPANLADGMAVEVRETK